MVIKSTQVLRTAAFSSSRSPRTFDFRAGHALLPYLALFLLLVFSLGCTTLLSSAYRLSFSVQETGKPVDGNVYLNGVFLGRASDGFLMVGEQNMTEGIVRFTGYYQGRPFNYSYSVSTDTLTAKQIAFTLEESRLKTLSMRFEINGTDEPLDGAVTNNDRPIGTTSNGKLDAPVKELQEGMVELSGTYSGKKFNFRFNLDRADFEKSTILFTVSKSEIENAVFDASDINRRSIEAEILRLVNVERIKAGAPALKYNGRAASVAYEHSKDMAQRDYFAHQSPEGDNVGERLKAANVFYTVAAEDLSLFENIRPETNLSDKAVQGWMGSPGHRAPIVDSDHLFSDAGAGVVCVSKTCYVTLVFLGNEKVQETTLPAQYLSFYYVYDPNYGFSNPVPLGITIDATRPITVYLVSSRKQYETLLAGQDTETLDRFKDITHMAEEYTVGPGTGLVIDNKGSEESKITIALDYYP